MVIPIPDFYKAQKLRLLVFKEEMGLISSSSLIHGALARVLRGQGGGNNRYFAQRVMLARRKQDATDARIQRQISQGLTYIR